MSSLTFVRGVNRGARRSWKTNGLIPRVVSRRYHSVGFASSSGMTSTRASDWRTLVPPFVVSVADTYDALTTKRSYNDPMMPTDAISLMSGKLVTRYDPEVMRALIGIFQKLKSAA